MYEVRIIFNSGHVETFIVEKFLIDLYTDGYLRGLTLEGHEGGELLHLDACEVACIRCRELPNPGRGEQG